MGLLPLTVMQETQEPDNPEGIFIYSSDLAPPLLEVPALFDPSEAGLIHECVDFSILKQFVFKAPYGCVVFEIKEAEQLKQLTEFSHLLGAKIEEGIVQLIVVCQLQHPKIEAFLGTLNLTKALFPPFTAKGLKIAIVRHLLIAKKAVAVQAQEREIEARAKGGYKKPPVRAKVVKEVDSLKTPDDSWLSKATSARHIHGRWLCTMLGPGPITGMWVEISGRRAEDRIWEWRTKDGEKDLFIREGVWRFAGRLPEFRQNSWTFIGIAPELAYYKNGASVERKLFCERTGDLVLARNSRTALRKLADIRASIDFEIYVKKNGGKTRLLEFVEKARQSLDKTLRLEGEESEDLAVHLEKDLAIAEKEFSLTAEHEKDSLKLKTADKWDGFGKSGDEAKPLRAGKFGKKAVSRKRMEIFAKADGVLGSGSKLFKLVESEIGKSARIKEAPRSTSPATMWTSKRQLRKQSYVLSMGDAPNTIKLAYPDDMSRTEMLRELHQQNADRVYFNINTRRTSMFFVHLVPDIGFGEDAMTVATPQVMYEVQRRDHFRYQFPPDQPLKVLIGLESNTSSPIEFLAKDISAGGAGLLFGLVEGESASRVRGFQDGQVFPNVSFEVYEKPIRCAAQLRWRKELTGSQSDPPFILLGLQFLHLSAEDREGIRLFVMEESFDYLESVLDAELIG